MTAAPAPWSHESGPADAPLVALVHGSMDRSAGLLRLSRRLDERFRVLRYDRRGYGRSRPHEGPFDMDGQVADLVGLLDGRPGLVVGHSYGGDVALAAADRHPQLVLGVLVYEPPLSWLPWWPTTTAGSQALAGEGEAADAAERFMRRLIGDERWERLPASTRAARREEGAVMVGELADLRAHEPWRPERIACPVVAMAGERGAEHHRLGVAHLGSTLPDVQTVVVPEAKHFGPNTHPDAIAADVNALAARISALEG